MLSHLKRCSDCRLLVKRPGLGSRRRFCLKFQTIRYGISGACGWRNHVAEEKDIEAFLRSDDEHEKIGHRRDAADPQETGQDGDPS